MLPKLILKALTAAASSPEIRRRVLAAARNPEVRQQVMAAAGKGIEAFRRWWAEHESLKNPEVTEEPARPKTTRKKAAEAAPRSRAKRPKGT